jgi:hypothetical protein
MTSGLWLEVGSAESTYQYLRCTVRLVNALAFFGVNPLNFTASENIDHQKQIQYIAALGLFFWDVLSATKAHSIYERVSFCLSALDKLANIVGAMAPKHADVAPGL